MLSTEANVIMVSSGANVIIWCYHVMLSSVMITPPFFVFPGNFTHSHITHFSLASVSSCNKSVRLLCPKNLKVKHIQKKQRSILFVNKRNLLAFQFITDLFTVHAHLEKTSKNKQSHSYSNTTLIHTATKNPFMYSFSGNCALMRSLRPNFEIHVSVSDLCISRIGPHISCSRIGRSIVGVYKSLTDT